MGKKILVVEDDHTTSKYLKEIFEDNGYKATIASDGAIAEALVKRIKPDLITLDLEMPKEWGPRFYRKMVQNKELKDTPVIVISGLSDPKHAIKNAVAVINKPFNPDKVLKVVKETIG
ncbi:MAG: response regulator [Deltaproteobacteria bacterium]|nr:response regulator [Deltaproteobacteria bacterium]